MTKRISLIFCLLLFPLNVFAQGWIGTYSGSKVPGYTTLESKIVWLDGFSAPTANFSFKQAVNTLVNDCSKYKGLAITNIQSSLSLGSASEKNDKMTTTYSPAIQYLIYADCVTKVKKD